MRKFISSNQVRLLGLLETKIKLGGFPSMYQNVCDGWCISSNITFGSSARIIICWDPTQFYVNAHKMSSQFIHCEIIFLASKISFECTFIYASNDLNDRYVLLDDLMALSSSIKNPWLVCGDFNNPLSPGDRIGSNVSWSEIEGFRHCVDVCGLFDLKSSGCFFTWNNKQYGDQRVLCKLDRMLANDDWIAQFPDSVAHFLPEGLFDHSPMVLTTTLNSGIRRKPFRYFNMWSLAEYFVEKVKESWSSSIVGVPMYQVISKLKRLKNVLRSINKEKFDGI